MGKSVFLNQEQASFRNCYPVISALEFGTIRGALAWLGSKLLLISYAFPGQRSLSSAVRPDR